MSASEENTPDTLDETSIQLADTSENSHLNISKDNNDAIETENNDININSEDSRQIRENENPAMSNDPLQDLETEVLNGWNETKTKYYVNNAALQGEQEIEGQYCYFDQENDSQLVSDKFVDLKDSLENPVTKYYTNTGIRAIGQLKIETNWYFFDPLKNDGMAKGEIYLLPEYNHGNGKWVYYDETSGAMYYIQKKLNRK